MREKIDLPRKANTPTRNPLTIGIVIESEISVNARELDVTKLLVLIAQVRSEIRQTINSVCTFTVSGVAYVDLGVGLFDGEGQLQVGVEERLRIASLRLAHMGDWRLREHVSNSKALTQKHEESKLRIVKKAPHRRIDLTVAASMAVSEVMRLNL